MTSLRSALAFLTVLGGPRDPAPAARVWFPAVGAVLGVVLGVTWAIADELWAAPVAAALVIVADLALTGLLHADGLADTADGLLPHAPRSRRLQIMSDPAVGAFGVAVVAAVLLLRWAALDTSPVAPWLLVALWASSRTIAAAAPDHMQYAREDGAARAFLAEPGSLTTTLVAVPVVAAAAAVAGLDRGVGGVIAVAAAVAAAIALLVLAGRRLGGFTGDVLGATIVVSETVGLVVAAARW